MASQYQPTKMRAAILFFCDRIRNGTLGRTKMAKLLYYLDFDHFEQHGAPVTGADYLHLPRGPYPKQMYPEIKAMRDTSIQEAREEVGPYTQFSYTLIRGVTPDVGVFTARELRVLFEVAEKWENQSGSEMVAATHGEAPWIATKERQRIPYEYAYYRRKFEFTPDTEEEEESSPLIP